MPNKEIKEIMATLIARIKRAPAIESFRFKLEEKVDFLSGQFLQVVFDEKNRNNKELNKFLSISSSPNKDYLEITKKLSTSLFSQRLSNLKVSDAVLLRGPLGNCVFKDEYKKVCFLIGGIGITPVISILEYILEKKLSTDVIVLYSNHSEEEIAFKKELDNWQKTNKNIKVIYAVTDCPPKDTQCVFVIINKELLLEKVPDLFERMLFVFGPPAMVSALKNVCTGLNCNKEKVKTESFLT